MTHEPNAEVNSSPTHNRQRPPGVPFQLLLGALVVATAGCPHPVPVPVTPPDPFQFQLPADINDFPAQPAKQAEMIEQWNWNLRAFTDTGVAGDPWTNVNDSPRSNYQNPTRLSTDEATAIQPITWTAFPNKVDWYFRTSQNNPYQLPRALLYPLIDEGRLDKNNPVLRAWAKYQQVDELLVEIMDKHPEFGDTDLTNFAPVKISTDVCPVVNWSQPTKDWMTFANATGVPGPRAWKDEYNEWVVQRNSKGQITKISFTAENPEYWFTLWRVDPSKVLELYHKLVGPQVQLEDLYLRDTKGNVTKDYRGKPFYNPLNQWNYGNHLLPNMGGAVHLTSPPNTVGAEIYLGAAATIIRALGPGEYSPQQNLCLSEYGGNFRNSDPNIGLQVNQVVRNLNMTVTLTNPVSLYMQTPDFSNYTTPDRTPASEFFHIVRGRNAKAADRTYDQILHAVFEVPPEKGYTVSDIKIGGTEIWWGAQIAETFNQALAGTAYADLPPSNYLPYPQVNSPKDVNAQTVQPLVRNEVLRAVMDNPKISSATIPVIPPAAVAGSGLVNMALEVAEGASDATIQYTREDGTVEPGIHVEIKDYYEPGPGHVPGKHGIYDTLIFVLDIDIGKDVKPGQYGVQVTNPGLSPQISGPGNLIVIGAE